jgi:hypothetical protein
VQCRDELTRCFVRVLIRISDTHSALYFVQSFTLGYYAIAGGEIGASSGVAGNSSSV